MKDKYKVVIVGFAHVHINDVAKHFYEHPRIDLCGAADVPPHMPEMKPGAIYTRNGISTTAARTTTSPNLTTGSRCWMR